MNADNLFSLYKRCFTGIIRGDDKVRSILSMPGNDIDSHMIGGELAGVSLMNKNVILMLCVAPEYRGHGIGSGLIDACVRRAADAGYPELRACAGVDYITPGIPIYGPHYEANLNFFTKRGFEHSWGECECVDMSMQLACLRDTGEHVGDIIRSVEYRWAVIDDMADITACAADACPEFEKYYRDNALYSGSDRRVLCAFCDGIAVGAVIVEAGVEAHGVGSVGCTITRTEYRGRGIASTLVRLGTDYLRNNGMVSGFIGYTYTDIVPLYARSGYSVSMKYLMGVKKLTHGHDGR